ncbi:MAG: hypothetical protein R3249_06905, partial [Nitriliruptorales bacterium]|nr:hypothetical protein [Nitriliruptorales bacterium]
MSDDTTADTEVGEANADDLPEEALDSASPYAKKLHAQFQNAEHLDPNDQLIQIMRRESHKTPLHALLDLEPVQM